jgi:hypothetical protein
MEIVSLNGYLGGEPDSVAMSHEVCLAEKSNQKCVSVLK